MRLIKEKEIIGKLKLNILIWFNYLMNNLMIISYVYCFVVVFILIVM